MTTISSGPAPTVVQDAPRARRGKARAEGHGSGQGEAGWPVKIALIVDLLPVDRPRHRTAGHLAARGQRSELKRVVDGDRLAPGLHPRELRRGARPGQHGQGLRQQPGDHPAGDDHPDHDRRVRRLRVQLHALPRPRLPVHPDRQPARGPQPGRPGAAAAVLRGPRAQRHLRRRLAGPHRLRHAAGICTSCGTTCRACRRS